MSPRALRHLLPVWVWGALERPLGRFHEWCAYYVREEKPQARSLLLRTCWRLSDARARRLHRTPRDLEWIFDRWPHLVGDLPDVFSRTDSRGRPW